MSGFLFGVQNVVSRFLSVVLLTRDAEDLFGIFSPPQWGIFDSQGNPILLADSVNGIEFTRDYQISDYPQEQGGWESYNKVQMPFQAKISFLLNRTRFEFLQQIEAAAASLSLVTVITPEVTYPSANIMHYGYTRFQQQGVSLVIVDVWVEEVRLTAGVQLGPNALQNNAGTGPVIGSLNSSNLSGNVSATSSGNVDYPITTQSTNGAYPASSGYNSPLNPGAVPVIPVTVTPLPPVLPVPN